MNGGAYFENEALTLNWSPIDSVWIYYDPNDSLVIGFKFDQNNNLPTLKIGDDAYYRNYQQMDFRHAISWVNIREGDRVVGIQAHKNGNSYHNLQLVIMKPY